MYPYKNLTLSQITKHNLTDSSEGEVAKQVSKARATSTADTQNSKARLLHISYECDITAMKECLNDYLLSAYPGY